MTSAGSLALVAGDDIWRGPQLTGLVRAAAAELTDAGIRPGDRVVLTGPNSPTYLRSLLALISLDTSLVLLDDELPPAEAQRLARTARARWWVFDPAQPAVAAEPRRQHPTTPSRPTAVAAPTTLPAPELAAASADPRPLSLAGWLRRRDAVVLWSSGTTGPPKAIVKSGPSIRGNTVKTAAVMAYRRDDVLTPWLPMSHQYGLSLVLLWWFAGCTLALAPYRRITAAVTAAARQGATVVDAAPATYHALLALLQRRPELGATLSRVRMWCVGGAPLPAPLAREFAEILGAPLLDGYGMTEAGNIALATPDNPVGCGRPLPGVSVQIRGEAGEPLGPGELGEVLVASDGLYEGELDPHGALVPAPHSAWYATNDLGYLDAHGNLHVVGRRRAVHRNGYTLYPEGLERRAEACGRPVKVIATADQRRGSTLTFVVADADGRDPKYWRRRLDQLLARYEQPNAVQVVPSFPRNSRGKVDEAQLRELLSLSGQLEYAAE